jgi:hypothetical protein
LRDVGLSVAVASSDYGLIGRLRMSLNLMDLTRALSIRLAVTRALRSVVPRAIIYGAAGAALLEPCHRLNRAAVRFDSLAVDNRPGVRHALQRALERRMVANAALLLPFSSSRASPAMTSQHQPAPIALPTPVDPYSGPHGPRQPLVLCYGGAPELKRLDLLVRAWTLAELPERHRLVVTGIDRAQALRWLAKRGIPEPPATEWPGHLDADAYRKLTSTASIFLAASRYEDFGIAQLEALADGALCVTTPSPGPYEALALARSLDPQLVSDSERPESLAAALGAAAALTDAERHRYRSCATEMMAAYSRARFRERLQSEVLPALFESAPPMPSLAA